MLNFLKFALVLAIFLVAISLVVLGIAKAQEFSEAPPYELYDGDIEKIEESLWFRVDPKMWLVFEPFYNRYVFYRPDDLRLGLVCTSINKPPGEVILVCGAGSIQYTSTIIVAEDFREITVRYADMHVKVPRYGEM